MWQTENWNLSHFGCDDTFIQMSMDVSEKVAIQTDRRPQKKFSFIFTATGTLNLLTIYLCENIIFCPIWIGL